MRPNMTSGVYHEDEVDVLCVDTDRTVKCGVVGFQDGVYLEVAITHVGSINLQYNKQQNVYIGNLAGLEFQSNGPKRIA